MNIYIRSTSSGCDYTNIIYNYRCIIYIHIFVLAFFHSALTYFFFHKLIPFFFINSLAEVMEAIIRTTAATTT